MARAILSCLGLGVAAATLTASGNPMLAVAVGTAAGGIAGNLGTDLFKALDRRAAERFLQGWSGIDENHHVAEALRLAQIKALRAVLKRFDATRETDADPFREDREDRFSAALSGFLDDETRLAQRAFAPDAAAPVEQEVRAAVLSRLPEAFDQSLATRRAAGERDAIAESAARLRDAVEAAVLAEIRLRTVPAEATLPPLFEAAFMGTGFLDAWFDLFVRDAAARLKENDAFERIWAAEQTALVKAIVVAHDAVLGRIDARTERIETQQTIDSTKLDEMLALLRASGTVAKAEAQGISEAAVRAIVDRLGGEGIARDDLVPWLDTWIEEARQALARTSNEGEAFEAARREAEQRFRAGRLKDASAAFMDEIAREDRIEQERQDERKRRRIRLLEEAVHFDELAFATDAALLKLRMIAEAEGHSGSDALPLWLSSRAIDLYRRGSDKGQNSALLLSIAVFRVILEECERERVPFLWATTQNNLSLALQALGERESGPARLEQALAACRETSEGWVRARVPLLWADLQNNLGNVLTTLGERRQGTALLEEAVQVFRAVILDRILVRDPFDRAAPLNNLGNVLRMLGERERNTARLEEAVAAQRAALEILPRRRLPLQWAATQNNLGGALSSLGERESGTARLQEAVVAFRAALEECTRERVPLEWAATQNNLGSALRKLGERQSGTARLEEAIKAYQAAAEESTRERTPFQWATIQQNLGDVLSHLGERERGTARLEEAVAIYRAVLEEWTRERVPRLWSATQNNLGNALMLLGERESGTARFYAAAQAFRAALEEAPRERLPLEWASGQNNLGNALQALGKRESGRARLEQAVAAYRAALEEWARERVPLDWATAQNNLGTVLLIIGERESGTERLEQAVAAYRAALEEWTYEYAPHYHEIATANLGLALAEIARRNAITSPGTGT